MHTNYDVKACWSAWARGRTSQVPFFRRCGFFCLPMFGLSASFDWYRVVFRYLATAISQKHTSCFDLNTLGRLWNDSQSLNCGIRNTANRHCNRLPNGSRRRAEGQERVEFLIYWPLKARLGLGTNLFKCAWKTAVFSLWSSTVLPYQLHSHHVKKHTLIHLKRWKFHSSNQRLSGLKKNNFRKNMK